MLATVLVFVIAAGCISQDDTTRSTGDDDDDSADDDDDDAGDDDNDTDDDDDSGDDDDDVTAYRGFAVGTDVPDFDGIVLQYGGGAWNDEFTGTAGVPCTIHALAGVSYNDLWAVGAINPAAISTGLALHWSAGAWSNVSLPDPPADGPWHLRDVAAVNGNELWAVGIYDDSWKKAYPTYGAVIYHYQLGSWTAPDSPGLVDELYELLSVDFPSASEGYAVGRVRLIDPDRRGAILVYDSGLWTEPAILDVGSTNWELNAVSAPATGQAWAVGGDLDAATAILVRKNGASWEEQTLPGSTADRVLNGIFMLSASSGWAVGTDQATASALIYRYASGTWSAQTIPDLGFDSLLLSVHAVSETAAWAVGEDTTHQRGLVLRFDGGAWVAETNPTREDGWQLRDAIVFPE
jgi:hypothetical protein